MTDQLVTLPFAVLPEGADPAAFYGTFTGQLTATPDADAVTVWVSDQDDLATVYAPVKAAMRFATDTLVLQTWPLSYTDLGPVLGSTVPAQVLIDGIDQTGVRDAVRELYAALGKPETSVDAFMAGDGLLLVPVGTPIGRAGPGAAPPDPALPNTARISAVDAAGQPVNATQFLADGAVLAGIDATLHPLLTALPLDGWIDVVVLDEAGVPLTAEAYDLYLSDGTLRSGSTGPDGRIAEAGMPPGEWALDLPESPSFAFEPGA